MSPDPCPVGLRGIVPSLNTPFTADDRIDVPSLRRLVEATISARSSGMLVLALAAESARLGLNEKRLIVDTVADQNAGRLPIVVAVSAADQAERSALAHLAGAVGAAGICAQAPAGLSGAALKREFAELAAAGAGFLMIQDLDWTGGGLPVEDIARLFEALPAFQCLKLETALAGPKYSRVLAATGGRLHVSGGWAVSQMIDALDRGVHAFMGTALDPLYVAVYERHRGGRRAAAKALFERLLPILAFANQHIDVSIRFWKRLRHVEGIFATDRCRPPVPEFDSHQSRAAASLIARALALQASLACDEV
ncbi:MAG: dihydrodipicolinate synthase family protein [Pseudomonadota bacterium]